jgi:hypothetical protein
MLMMPTPCPNWLFLVLFINNVQYGVLIGLSCYFSIFRTGTVGNTVKTSHFVTQVMTQVTKFRDL